MSPSTIAIVVVTTMGMTLISLVGCAQHLFSSDPLPALASSDGERAAKALEDDVEGGKTDIPTYIDTIADDEAFFDVSTEDVVDAIDAHAASSSARVSRTP